MKFKLTKLFLLLFFSSPLIISCSKTPANPSQSVGKLNTQKVPFTNCDPNTISIGAVLPLTGAASDFGVFQKAAFELALADVNQQMEDEKNGKTVQLTLLDGQTIGINGIDVVSQFPPKCARIVVGLTTSDFMVAVKGFFETNDMLGLSDGATDIILAGAGTNVFRTNITGPQYYKAIAHQAISDNQTCGIEIYRNDPAGNSFNSAFETEYAAAGGTLLAKVQYDISTQNFDAYIYQLEQYITTNENRNCDKSNTAVFLNGYEESVSIGIAALKSNILSALRWYGSPYISGLSALLNEAKYPDTAAQFAQFAHQTKFTGANLGVRPDKQEAFQNLIDRLKAKGFVTDLGLTAVTYTSLFIAVQTQLSIISKGYTIQNVPMDVLRNAMMEAGTTVPSLINNGGFSKDQGPADPYISIYQVNPTSSKWEVIGDFDPNASS